jgi:uncharacterized protein YukE
MKPLEVDPDSYRRAKLNIGQSNEDTDAALSTFVSELESYGEPWGNDDLGSLIGMSYQGIFAVAMDCFATNLDVIDNYAERLGNAADDYERTDQASAEPFQKTQASLPDLPL